MVCNCRGEQEVGRNLFCRFQRSSKYLFRGTKWTVGRLQAFVVPKVLEFETTFRLGVIF